MALFCTNCGEKLDGAALFCTGCGQKTEQQPAAAPAPPMGAESPLGARPMSPAPAARQAAKPGNAKVLVWMGVLVLLLAVTFGLAYVAYQRFAYQDAAPEAASGPDPATEGLIIEPVPAPVGQPLAEAPAEEEPPPAEEPVVAAALPPVAGPPPTPARAIPKPAPQPIAKARPAAPAPIAAPTPPAPAPEPAPPVETRVPDPAPIAQPAKAEPPAPPPPPKGSKVMLSGSEAYSPPPPPAAAPPRAGAPSAPPPAPRAGDVFWAGTLEKNQVVTVDFASGAAGVGGQPLPGKPVRLETFSPVVEMTELPGPENGWKRFSFKAKRDAKRSVTLNFHWTLQ